MASSAPGSETWTGGTFKQFHGNDGALLTETPQQHARVGVPSAGVVWRPTRMDGLKQSRPQGEGPGRSVSVWARLYLAVRDTLGVIGLVAGMLAISGGVAAAILILGRLVF